MSLIFGSKCLGSENQRFRVRHVLVHSRAIAEMQKGDGSCALLFPAENMVGW